MVFKATSTRGDCQHAVKFVPSTTYPPWEVQMIRSCAGLMGKNIVTVFCAGLSRHAVACQQLDQDTVTVIVQELMDEDLWEKIYHPPAHVPWLCSDRKLLKGMCRQLLEGLSCECLHRAFLRPLTVSALETHGFAHGDVKPENIMVKYQDSKPTFKLIDLGNVYRSSDKSIPGCTLQYLAPEHVVGKWNSYSNSDVFSAGLVVFEILSQSAILPKSLTEAYTYCGKNRRLLDAQGYAPLYHLVLLASLIAGREVWAGKVMRRYYGNFSKQRICATVLHHFPDADVEIFSILVSDVISAPPLQVAHRLFHRAGCARSSSQTPISTTFYVSRFKRD